MLYVLQQEKMYKRNITKIRETWTTHTKNETGLLSNVPTINIIMPHHAQSMCNYFTRGLVENLSWVGTKDLYQVQETWKYFYLTYIQLCVLKPILKCPKSCQMAAQNLILFPLTRTNVPFLV